MLLKLTIAQKCVSNDQQTHAAKMQQAALTHVTHQLEELTVALIGQFARRD